jgi:hypothetical protein
VLWSSFQCCSTEEELIYVLDVCLLMEEAATAQSNIVSTTLLPHLRIAKVGSQFRLWTEGCKQIRPVDYFWLRH